MSAAPDDPGNAAEATIDLRIDAGFGRWIEGADATLIVTTYQAGKVVLVGHDGARPTVLIRDLHAPMGLAVEPGRLAIALRESVIELEDARDDAVNARFEHVYRPRVTHATGDVRAHEIAFGRDGLWIVNTKMSCLGVAAPASAFEPRWRPSFITALAAEDRCHLSGLAMEDGAPAYVTAHAATDAPGGWRARKLGGGVVVDVATGAPLSGGFTMPHSPRLAGGALWLLDSGQGVLLRVDRRTGARTPVARVPGFARGLCIVGDRALVGLSKVRESDVFGGLPISQRGANLVCGVAVVDTASGLVEGLLRFTSGCEEIFDVGLLRGERRVQLFGP